MGDARSLQTEHILCLLPFPEDKRLLGKIKEKHPNVEFTYIEFYWSKGRDFNPTIVPDEIWHRSTILVTLGAFPPSASLTPNLKLIHLCSAGADRIVNLPIFKETTIPFTNSSGVHGPQISEWVIMQILSFSHKQKLLMRWQREKHWAPLRDVGDVRDGVGLRLGVLGYGAIGRQTARVAQALGMTVIAYTASPRPTPSSKHDKGYIVPGTGDPLGTIPSEWYSGLDKPSLYKFLSADLDILLVSVPLTPATHHLLSAPEFAILGDCNCFILNVARGAILNQEDLIAALKRKREDSGLAGAALDVTDPEPLEQESELWTLENVAITPHVSGLGTAYAERTFGILEVNLGRLEKGQELINLVDRKKGY